MKIIVMLQAMLAFVLVNAGPMEEMAKYPEELLSYIEPHLGINYGNPY